MDCVIWNHFAFKFRLYCIIFDLLKGQAKALPKSISISIALTIQIKYLYHKDQRPRAT